MTENQNNPEIFESTSFSISDLRDSLKLVEMFQGTSVHEQQPTSEEKKIDKYISMRDLKEFIVNLSSR